MEGLYAVMVNHRIIIFGICGIAICPGMVVAIMYLLAFIPVFSLGAPISIGDEDEIEMTEEAAAQIEEHQAYFREAMSATIPHLVGASILLISCMLYIVGLYLLLRTELGSS